MDPALPTKRRLLLMVSSSLYARADESGINLDAADYLLMCGYIGTPRQWKNLERDWSAVLKKFGVRRFHATRFFGRGDGGSRLDDYKRWSDQRAKDFLDALLDILHRRKLTPIGSSLNVAAWHALSPGERRYLTGGEVNASGKWTSSGAPSSPYHFVFQDFLYYSAKSAPEDSQIHFVFDRQTQFSTYATTLFNEIIDEKKVEPDPVSRTVRF